MRVKVCESQSSGSTLFILQVCSKVATVAQVRPPPWLPANRLFFRVIVMPDSLCCSFSNGGKQGFLVLVGDATRASTRDRGFDGGLFEVRCADLMGGAGHDLLGGQESGFDDTPDFMVGDAEFGRGFRHGEPFSASIAGRPVALDLVYPAQRADAMPCPGLSLTGPHPHAVERGGDICVGPARRHRSDDGHRLLGRAFGVFAGLWLANVNLRMLSALPVYSEFDLSRIIVDGHDDILDQRAQEPLPKTHVDIGSVPCSPVILSQAGNIRDGGLTHRELADC